MNTEKGESNANDGRKEAEKPGTGDGDDQLSPFWYSATLERSLSLADKDAAEKKLRRDELVAKMNKAAGTSDYGLMVEGGPSFSMGMTQEFDGVRGNEIVVSQLVDPKPIQTWNPPSLLDRGKRSLKLPPRCKSPYAKRVVDIGARMTAAETKV